jgi:hypothetical protein
LADVRYPALDPDEVARLSERLLELVNVRFGGRLSQEVCAEIIPPLREVRPRHWAACHFA